MLAQNSKLTQDYMKEEFKKDPKKEVKQYVKKIKSFHMGRTPHLFPGLTMDVTEIEFGELMMDLDNIYDTAHRLNVVLMKYTRSIESINLIMILYRVDKDQWDFGTLGSEGIPSCSCEPPDGPDDPDDTCRGEPVL